MRISSAEQKDVESILSIRSIVHADYYPREDLGITRDDAIKTDALAITTDRGNLVSQIKDTDGSSRVDVLGGDGVIGGYCVSRKLGLLNTIDYAHVLPEFQGNGYGRKLASRAIEWLGDDRPIWIEVAKHNERGKKFWERLGFVMTRAEAKKPKVMSSGIVLPHIEMVKEPGISLWGQADPESSYLAA